MKTLFLLFLPTLLFGQQTRQNLTYEIDVFVNEYNNISSWPDTIDLLTYVAWNPAVTNTNQAITWALTTDVPQGFGARVGTFVKNDTTIFEPDTLRFARIIRKNKKQTREDFELIKVTDGSFDLFDNKGKLVRREFVGDPELVFYAKDFRKDRDKITGELKKRKKKKDKKNGKNQVREKRQGSNFW